MRFVLAILISLLAACASPPQYTIDDGRQVNAELLSQIRHYGQGERALRAAIARSAALNSKCDTQWELPFSVISSYGETEDDRVAWMRELGVDERLTVIAIAPNSPLQLGDKIKKIGRLSNKKTEHMRIVMERRRDDGDSFNITLSTDKVVEIQPFKVCRGHTYLATPKNPTTQDHHWLASTHPLEVAQVGLSDDEALWVVLWAQGLSEEAGLRMKTYDYGTGILSSVFTLASIASGIQGTALASEAAMNIARSATLSAATNLLTKKMIEQALTKTHKPTQQQTVNAMQMAAANRQSLKSISWIASTLFEEADAWAYDKLSVLNANPLSGFTLHQKLLEKQLTSNSMMLDFERFQALHQIATNQGKSNELATILNGTTPESLMPYFAINE